jgi:hypothetical protein
MAASGRIDIAVPPELKSRMDAASASNVIRPNWSAVFRVRVEAELANLEHQRGDQTAAIVRLRSSRLENEQYELIEGRAHGRVWAEQRVAYVAPRGVLPRVFSETWPVWVFFGIISLLSAIVTFFRESADRLQSDHAHKRAEVAWYLFGGTTLVEGLVGGFLLWIVRIESGGHCGHNISVREGTREVGGYATYP